MRQISTVELDTKIVSLKTHIEFLMRHERAWNTSSKYLTVKLSPYKSYTLQISIESFNWCDELELYEFETSDNNVHSHRFVTRLRPYCRLKFINKDNLQETTEVLHSFDFKCTYSFDLSSTTRNNDALSLIDEDLQLIQDSNDRIFQIYKKYSIDDTPLEIDGGHFRDRIYELVSDVPPAFPVHWLEQWEEFYFCLQSLRYSIAELDKYHPYLDNPLWNVQITQSGTEYFSANPRIYDQRYYMYCGFAYQSLYNFWDRVGDLIAKIVDTGLSPSAIDFPRSIDKIKASGNHDNNNHFMWLYNFRETYFKQINSDRINIVHYSTINTTLARTHLEAFRDREKMEERQNWIEGRVDFMVEQFGNCIQGLKELLRFWETK